jgi:hypothetical protein
MRVRIDNFLGEFGLIVIAAKLGNYSPSHEGDKKECRCGRQPVPKEGPRSSIAGRNRAEFRPNLLQQRSGCDLIELRGP